MGGIAARWRPFVRTNKPGGAVRRFSAWCLRAMPSTSGMLTNEKAGMADRASDDKVTGSMDRAEPELMARAKS